MQARLGTLSTFRKKILIWGRGGGGVWCWGSQTLSLFKKEPLHVIFCHIFEKINCVNYISTSGNLVWHLETEFSEFDLQELLSPSKSKFDTEIALPFWKDGIWNSHAALLNNVHMIPILSSEGNDGWFPVITLVTDFKCFSFYFDSTCQLGAGHYVGSKQTRDVMNKWLWLYENHICELRIKTWIW